MKDRKDVKDMDEKEFLERYASKKDIDDADKRSKKNLRDQEIEKLNKLIEDVEKDLTKEGSRRYCDALREFKRIKEDIIDFYHKYDIKLTKEDFNDYNNKIKSEIKKLVEKAEDKLSKVSTTEQKAYKKVIDEANDYLKKIDSVKSVTPIMDEFEKDLRGLREKYGSKKSDEAVTAYKNLALSVKDPEHKVECLKEAKERYASTESMANSLQREIDHIKIYNKKNNIK